MGPVPHAHDDEKDLVEPPFKVLAESVPVLIWMAGADGRWTFFNRRWLAFTGRAMEQEAGEGWAEGLHPEDRQRSAEVYREAFSRRLPFEMEYRLRRADGEYRWILTRGDPLVAGGEFEGYVGGCIDITERMQIEAERELLLTTAQEAVAQALLLQTLTAGLAPLRDRGSIARYVLGEGVTTLGGRTGSLCLVTPERGDLEIVAHVGYPPDVMASYSTFPLDAPLPASETVRTGESVFLRSSAERNARFPLLSSAGLSDEAYAIVPLAQSGEKAVGALVVGFAEARDFTDKDAVFLEALARQCAIALERSRLYEEAQAVQRRLAFLADVSGFLAGSLDPAVTLTQVAALAVPHVADWCAIHLVDGQGGVGEVAGASGDPRRVDQLETWLNRYPVIVGAPAGAGAVLGTGRAEIYPDLTPEVLASLSPSTSGGEAQATSGFGSAVFLPLRARGRVLGALSLFNDATRPFTDDDVDLARELAGRAAVAIDTARLFAERSQVARRLQDSLLPASLPQLPGIELGARYRAAGEGLDVGGDFYDAFPVHDGRWMLAVGDVRGQGIEAAAVTGLARNTIRSAAVAGGPPRQILAHLNDVLLRQEAERAAGSPDDWEASEPRFLTVLLVSVQPTETGLDAVICAAGHPPPLLRRADGTVVATGASGSLVGILPDMELREVPVTLGPGDALVCFTDGVTERHELGRFMGEAGVVAALADTDGLDAAGVAEVVELTAVSFAEGRPAEDDMAILVLRVPPRDAGGAG